MDKRHMRVYLINKPVIPDYLINDLKILPVDEIFIYRAIVFEHFLDISKVEAFMEYMDAGEVATEEIWNYLRVFDRVCHSIEAQMVFQINHFIVQNELILGYHIDDVDYVDCCLMNNDISVVLSNE